MKKALHNISFVIGSVLLLGGLLFYGLNTLGFLSIENPKMPVVIIILGIGFIIGGACESFIKTNKKMQIDANDERNIIIGKTAKSFAFNIMSMLLAIAMIVLVLFDFISTEAFFMLFGVYIFSQAAFIFKLWYLQKKM